jgi:multidrug efflux pump subunit AcrB
MFRPLAIAVIGALCISGLLSLVATPVCITSCARPKNPRPIQKQRRTFNPAKMKRIMPSLAAKLKGRWRL